jgi:hypothetical protein
VMDNRSTFDQTLPSHIGLCRAVKFGFHPLFREGGMVYNLILTRCVVPACSSLQSAASTISSCRWWCPGGFMG